MTQENALRVGVLIVGLGTGVIAAIYRRRAHTGEPISRRDEGLPFALVLRLLGLGLWIVLIGYLVDADWAARFQYPSPQAARWACLGVALVGAAGLRWTLESLGKNLTDTVVVRRDAALVTTGPYRFVRHPFYVTTGMVMFGIAGASANGLLAALCVAVWTMLAVRTPKEEQQLIERFGDDYRRYMAVTNRFFPRIPA